MIGRPPKPAPERFWPRVERCGIGCWNWLGGVDKNGYGKFVDGRSIRAHVWSWTQANGPVPDGLVLDHLCDTPGCVRPDHLEPVTNRENVLRGNTPAAANLAKTHCPKGHPYDEANTYVRPDNGKRLCRACRSSAARESRIGG